jgi:hypothetical protein
MGRIKLFGDAKRENKQNEKKVFPKGVTYVESSMSHPVVSYVSAER